MEQLRTLYSRTSSGKVQEWSILVEGNAFYTVSGQTDGKKVTSKKTVCKGKNSGKANATTPETQAIAEALSKWEKKAKTGYTPDLSLIDSCVPYVDVILAKSFGDYEDKIDWKVGKFVQNKYNGVRCTARLEKGRVVLRSRKGEEWLAVPHLNKDLMPFFEKHPYAFLDGELYNYELRKTLNELTKLARKTSDDELTPELFAKTEIMVRFYIYDGAGFSDTLDADAPYEKRKEWIDENLPKYSKHYRHVKTWKVFSKAKLDELYLSFLADGEEGAIIRTIDMPYDFGSRTSDLLKYKPVDSDECEILAINEGVGNSAGLAATATINWKGKVFNATFMGERPIRAKILTEADQWVGRKNVEFLYNGLSGLGVPNYARIDPENCDKGDR